MNTQNTSKLALLLATAVAAFSLAIPLTVQAATIVAKFKANGAAVCQGALPSGAGAVLRARPLALQNEGASTAFVTCAFPYDDELGDELPFVLGLRLVNNTAAAVDFSCTLVSGTDSSNANYVVRATFIPANSGLTILYNPSELPGDPDTIFAPNLSCGLPPGAGISFVFYYFNQQIGL